MNLTDVTFKLLFLFLPGIISLIVIDTLTVHKKWDKFRYFLYSFVLGIINYSVWFLLSKIRLLDIGGFYFLSNIFTVGKLDAKEVALVTLCMSVPVGLALTFMINRKFIFRVARFLGVSSKIGDIDIWSYIFNAVEQEKIDWVVIRDYEIDKMYEGWVASYSSSDIKGKDELFLIDVKVYVNSTAELLYKTPGIYFATERGKVSIEFPNLDYKKLRDPKKEETNGRSKTSN